MIAEIMDYAIILLDLDGTILTWNKGAQAIKGV
jgi:PAS domain-containing protein